MAAPITRKRRCIQQPRCIIRIVPDELWVPILCHLLMIQDVCRMKGVCSFFDADLLHHVIACRIQTLYQAPFHLQKASTLIMSQKERLWSGIRLVAIDRRSVPDIQTRHTDLIVLREDPPLAVGRRYKECNILDPTVSRLHFMILLNQYPHEDYALKIFVMGQNGIRFPGTVNTSERIIFKDKSACVDVGEEFEVAVGTGISYRVEYL
jgi:hypothetical protein